MGELRRVLRLAAAGTAAWGTGNVTRETFPEQSWRAAVPAAAKRVARRGEMLD
jgi:hypothetical protein